MIAVPKSEWDTNCPYITPEECGLSIEHIGAAEWVVLPRHGDSSRWGKIGLEYTASTIGEIIDSIRTGGFAGGASGPVEIADLGVALSRILDKPCIERVARRERALAWARGTAYYIARVSGERA